MKKLEQLMTILILTGLSRKMPNTALFSFLKQSFTKSKLLRFKIFESLFFKDFLSKTQKISVFLLTITVVFTSCQESTEPYKDTKLSFEERAADLVSRMTIEEKISQMVYEAPAIERLGIPEYNWWNECLHGVGRAGLATVFPQSIGMAAMWDSEKMFEIGTAVSDEARAKHHDFAAKGQRGIYQGLTFWTPNINIFRDPRWGRGMETYGEDPYLTGEMALGYIKGLQGDHDRYLKLVATSKHFVVHSGPEPDRHRFNANPARRDFVETYTPHFKRTIQEGGVYSVMCAYNRLFDEPCCGSKYLESLLRDDWGFEGYIVSDCWAIRDFYREGDHEVVNTVEEAAALAVQAGTDLNCGNSYPALVNAYEQGLVTEEEIDVLVTRLMVARMKLGMFDPPSMVPYTDIPYSVVDSEKHRQMALDAARESMVLLKNDNNTLPLDKNLENIAVIGPNAHYLDALLANYNGFPSDPKTPFTGIKEKLPGANVQYAIGSRHAEKFPFLTVVPEEVLFSDESLEENGFSAQYFSNTQWEGQPAWEGVEKQLDFVWWNDDPKPGIDNREFSALFTTYLVPPVSGEYHIGAEGFTGFTLSIDDEKKIDTGNEHHPSRDYTTLILEAGKPYKITIEYQQLKSNYPTMKFLWDMPGQNLKQEAMQIAAESDAVIMCMGLSPHLEGEEMKVQVPGFLGGDRTDIALPSVQKDLIKSIMSLNKPTVLVLLNGSALAFNREAENVPAILEAWYPGQSGGTAIADILFGDYNPAGRLPVTFYKSVDQIPPFDDYSMEGRTYKYFGDEPLFEFGYGLSYTTFQYSNLTVPKEVNAGENVSVSVEVTNTGESDGDEVVQLYLSFPALEDAPLRTLQGFRRIHLKKGETQTVSFALSPEQMALYHPENDLMVYEGEMMVSTGGKQPDAESIENQIVLQETIQVKGTKVIE